MNALLIVVPAAVVLASIALAGPADGAEWFIYAVGMWTFMLVARWLRNRR